MERPRLGQVIHTGERRVIGSAVVQTQRAACLASALHRDRCRFRASARLIRGGAEFKKMNSARTIMDARETGVARAIDITETTDKQGVIVGLHENGLDRSIDLQIE